MSTHYHQIRGAERAGRSFGWIWRKFTRQEARIARELIGAGLPPAITSALLWILKLAVLAVIGYAVFWLGMLLLVILVVATAATRPGRDSARFVFEPNDPNDHRQRLFYDPLTHNDDPDPRWEDK